MAVDSGKEPLKEEDKSVSIPPAPKPVKSSEDEIREVARKFTSQPLQNSDVGVWGILTAISKMSRKRPQTQLRAFYSTTEEISALFAKQQEQLKAMQKTLEDEENYAEDEENYANTLMGVDLIDSVTEAVNAVYLKVRDETHHGDNTRGASGDSTPKNIHTTRESSDDSSTTEKHNCDMENQDGNTQDLECTSSDRLVKGFISDIDGVGTAVAPDGDINDTERVLGTESQFGDAGFDEKISALHKCSNLAGNTLQLDDEVQIQENLEPVAMEPPGTTGLCSELRMEDDTETAATRTADLLALEVAGSWAVSTAPSILGENESPRSPGDPRECAQDATASGGDTDAAAGSQSNVTRITKLSKEHKALNSMIAVVAPEFGQQFLSDGGNKNDSVSDAETENGSDDSDNDDTEGDSVEDGNEAMIEDSVD